MKKLLLLFCFLYTISHAEELVEEASLPLEEESFKLDLNYIDSLKKGLERNFYINEYLKSDISPEQAFQTLKYVDNMNDEIFFNFAKKFKDDETLAVAQCMNMQKEYLVDSYANCIAIGLSLEKATLLSAIELEQAMQKLSSKYPTLAKELKVISSSIPFTKLIVQKKDIFYDIYFNVSKEFRTKYFNYKLPKRTFAKIFKDSKKFDKFLELTLINREQKVLNKSLLDIDDTNLNANSSFLLALNALEFADINRAFNYLESASKKDESRSFQEKVSYWKFLITKDESYLQALAEAESLSFYTIYAKEILLKPLNGFSFLKRVEDIDAFQADFDSKRVALLYSLAKVESNFNSLKISENFNLGMMQLDSLTVKTISKDLNENYTLIEQLEANISLKYANTYVSTLELQYKSPIRIYLAYLKENNSLKILEDFNSFEMSDYRSFIKFEYIKSPEKLKEFVANYYLYLNALSKEDKSITLSSIFETLIPSNQMLDEKAKD